MYINISYKKNKNILTIVIQINEDQHNIKNDNIEVSSEQFTKYIIHINNAREIVNNMIHIIGYQDNYPITILLLTAVNKSWNSNVISSIKYLKEIYLKKDYILDIYNGEDLDIFIKQ